MSVVRSILYSFSHQYFQTDITRFRFMSAIYLSISKYVWRSRKRRAKHDCNLSNFSIRECSQTKFHAIQDQIISYRKGKQIVNKIGATTRISKHSNFIASATQVPVAENTIGNHDLSARKYVAGNCKCFGHTNQFC